MSCYLEYVPLYWRYVRKKITYKEYVAELNRLDSLRGKQIELPLEKKK